MDFNQDRISGLKRTLDFRNGLLTRSAQITTSDGGVYEIIYQRFASMNNPRLAALRYEIQVMKPTGNLTLKAEGKTPDQYKVAKQADTLMLFYVLKPAEVTALISNMGYDLPEDYLARNLAYYIARTSHGSTLSRVVHAWLGGLTHDPEMAWALYRGALVCDYTDIQGATTAGGIHTGVMAGTVLIAMTLYGGLDLNGNTPVVKPKLPPLWRSIAFNYTFKGNQGRVDYKK